MVHGLATPFVCMDARAFAIRSEKTRTQLKESNELKILKYCFLSRFCWKSHASFFFCWTCRLRRFSTAFLKFRYHPLPCSKRQESCFAAFPSTACCLYGWTLGGVEMPAHWLKPEGLCRCGDYFADMAWLKTRVLLQILVAVFVSGWGQWFYSFCHEV